MDAGVDREGLPELHRAAPLVDMAVQRQDRAVVEDRLANRVGPDRDQCLAAGHVTHVGVDLRGVVQIRAERRCVEVEDRPALVGNVGDEAVDALPELGLGQLTERVPGRRVGPARGHERDPLEIDQVALAELDQGRRGDDRVDLEDVVVGRRDDAADALAGQALVGERHPALDLGEHLRLESGVDELGIALPRRHLVRA